MSRKLRKLLSESLLEECNLLKHTGVPIAKIISQKSLNVSSPHMTRLLTLLDASRDEVNYTPYQNKLIKASLFPDWLIASSNMQTQPAERVYSGPFPLGQWEEHE
jgi:hypothetical protein